MTRFRSAGERKNIDGAFTKMVAKASYKCMGTVGEITFVLGLDDINEPMISDNC